MSLKGYIEGAIGEQDAKEYLEDKGYKILERNFKDRFGEIDIIAKKKDCFVFVEVKARQTDKFGRPGEFVTIDKQTKIKKTALAWLQKKNLIDADIRFDVIEILGDQINLIENAF